MKAYKSCSCTTEWLQESAPKPLLLAELSVPGNAGRSYGALTADRNPIHLSSLTSQVCELGVAVGVDPGTPGCASN